MVLLSVFATIITFAMFTRASATKPGEAVHLHACDDGTITSSSRQIATPTTTNIVPTWTSSLAAVDSSQMPETPLATILAEYTSQYHVSTGAVNFDTDRGLVSRFPQNGGEDITTILTFNVLSEYNQRQCQVVFDIGSDSTSYVTGTGKAQLFTSLAPITAGASTWPSGNLRDQFQGTLVINAHGRATWERSSGFEATYDGKFPCSAIAGRPYGCELVPIGDADGISWLAGTHDGAKILIL